MTPERCGWCGHERQEFDPHFVRIDGELVCEPCYVAEEMREGGYV